MSCKKEAASIAKRRLVLRKAMDEAKDYTENKTIRALADTIGVSCQTLYAQADTGYFSPKICKALHNLTHGSLQRERLNPRVYG